MIYYTIKHKTVQCPRWKTSVTLSCKYRFPNEQDSTEPATKMIATCPIRESAGHPKRELDYMICSDDNCPYLINNDDIFPRELPYPYS